jgi:hypothetical protein
MQKTRLSFWQIRNVRFGFLVLLLCVLAGSGAAQDDPNAQYILLQTGELRAGEREIDAPVEVGVLRLHFTLQAEPGIRWTVITPSGKPMTLTDPNVAVTELAGRRTIAMWDPRPGPWKLRLSGAGRFTLTAAVQGELYICCVQFWGRNGFAGMDRYQPARGSKQQAQVYASGFNIETIQFDLINEQGAPIAPVKARQSDFSNPYNFTLLLEAPDQPFRLRVRGRDLSGKPYQRVFSSLIRPQSPESPQAQNEAAAGAPRIVTPPQEWNPAATEGEIRIIRAHIAEWSDEPLLSEAGNPIGIRLRYAIRFPADGSYSPHPQVHPERIGSGYTGALGMRLLKGTVEPMPAGLSNATQFLMGGRAEFRAGTLYRFTADLVPNYALFDEQKKRFCLQSNAYSQPGLRERFDRELAGEQRLRYRISFAGADLDGRTPALTEHTYVPNHWRLGFKREGAVDCP